MNNLDDQKKRQLKESFRQYQENKDNIREINLLNKDIVNSLSEILGAKPKEIRKAFSFLAEKEVANKDTLQEVVDIAVAFEV